MPSKLLATRTSWADSYTSAKTEKPSLASAPLVPVVTLAAQWAVAAATVATVVTPLAMLLEALLATQHEPFMFPTSVPLFSFLASPSLWRLVLTGSL